MDVDRSFHASARRYYSGCDRWWTDRCGWDVSFAWLPFTTALFLLTTALTSLTGFLFPIHGLTPALSVGILACVILAVALFALYKEHLVGAWRWIFAIAAVASLYLNVFVLVVQSFVKVSALNALAPTQSEPPFAITQVVVLAIFILIALIAAVKFRPGTSVRA